jgi:hypothetical protein
MASSCVLELVDVLNDGTLPLPSYWPFLPPDQFRLPAFEEGFERSVVIAITLAAHGWTQAVGLQLLLIGSHVAPVPT